MIYDNIIIKIPSINTGINDKTTIIIIYCLWLKEYFLEMKYSCILSGHKANTVIINSINIIIIIIIKSILLSIVSRLVNNAIIISGTMATLIFIPVFVGSILHVQIVISKY